jgi:hypothetical protein
MLRLARRTSKTPEIISPCIFYPEIMAAKRVVDAVNVTAAQVICPCGQVIELEPDFQAPDVAELGKMVPAAIGRHRLPPSVAPKCDWIGSWTISYCGKIDRA